MGVLGGWVLSGSCRLSAHTPPSLLSPERVNVVSQDCSRSRDVREEMTGVGSSQLSALLLE